MLKKLLVACTVIPALYSAEAPDYITEAPETYKKKLAEMFRTELLQRRQLRTVVQQTEFGALVCATGITLGALALSGKLTWEHVKKSITTLKTPVGIAVAISALASRYFIRYAHRAEFKKELLDQEIAQLEMAVDQLETA